MASSALESIPGSAPPTQPPQAALPSPPSLLLPSEDSNPSPPTETILGRPQNWTFFFDPASEKAAKLSADLLALIPDDPTFITLNLEEATHVLLAQPSTYADQLLQARARSPPPPSSSSSSSRPQQLLTLDWVEESIRLKEWQPEDSYVYVSIPEKEGKGREGRVSRRLAGGSSVPEPHLPKGKVLKPKEKKETTKASKKKAVPAAYSVQESSDLRRFLRESQTIADACEKMVAAHPRRTAGTVRVYYSKNKDEFEDELGSEAPVHSWVWTPDEHVLLVKVLAGPVGSLNRGFKAFSEQHPKRSVIAAAKYYQNNRIRLELEIEALQKDPSSWSSSGSKKTTDGSPGSPSSSESSTMEWGEQEEIEIVQSEPKRRKKPAPSIPYTEEETADLQRILRESETLKEAAEKMEKTHPRRTAVSIGMYCYRHKETFATDFKPRPPSIPWTKQEEQDLLRTFATSTETLLMQCQAVHDMHPHRTPLSVSAYWFKHRDRLSPLVDAIKQTLPPPPPPPPPPAPTTTADAPSFASILGSINSLLQNNPQAPSSSSSSSKRPSEEPSAPSPPKLGRLDASPPPEVILASSTSTSGSMLGLLALPRLAPPKPPPTKPQPKPRKSYPTTEKIKVEEREVVASPVLVASKPTPPGRIILRLPPSSSSNLSTSATAKPSPSKKAKLEPPSPLPPPPPPAPVVAPTIPKFSLPRLSLSARPSDPKVAVPVALAPAAQPPTAVKPISSVSQEELPEPEAEEEVAGGKGTRRSSRRR